MQTDSSEAPEPAPDECPEGPAVTAMVDGELSRGELSDLHLHLASCALCQAQLKREMQTMMHVEDIRRRLVRERRIWVMGSAALGFALLGNFLAGGLGALGGAMVGYALYWARYGGAR